MPKMTKTPFQGSHMFPFEKPEELAMEINGILGEAKLNWELRLVSPSKS